MKTKMSDDDMAQSEKDFRKLLEDSKDDPDFKREKAELEQGEQFCDLNELLKDDWVPCNTDQEIIDRYGQETFDLVTKVVESQSKRIALREKRSKTFWGRYLNWRTDRQERKAAVNFIMYGPGGD